MVTCQCVSGHSSDESFAFLANHQLVFIARVTDTEPHLGSLDDKYMHIQQYIAFGLCSREGFLVQASI